MSHENVLSNKERQLLLTHETITRGSIEPFIFPPCTVTPSPSKKKWKKNIHSSYCFCSVFHPFVTAKLYGTISDDTLLYPYSAVLLANCGALMVGCLRFVLCFIALLSNSKEAVTSCFVLVLCFLKSQCEFAVTASYSVNTLRMIWAVRWCTVAVGGPFERAWNQLIEWDKPWQLN